MSEGIRRDDLVTRFRQTGAVIEEFVAGRTPEEQRAKSTPEGWSVGDLLTAIAFWMDYTVERIAFYQRGEAPPREVDFGGVQERAIRAAAGEAWGERVGQARRALAGLTATVEGCSDAVLEAENTYGEGPGGPLSGEVQANGFIWPLQELEKYLRRRGEAGFAERIGALLTPVVGEPELIVCALVEAAELRGWQQDAAHAPLVIDVRGAADFARGHVAGARHIPLAKLAQQMKRLPTDRRIVTYCNMHHPGQSRGERAAHLLSEAGFQAMAIAGGYPAWEAAGGPVEVGTSAEE
jgi:phage shock protein E